jgi:anti-sigma regulatory factor (Ser/Thr protein kinase)
MTGDRFLAGAVGGAGEASRLGARALILDQRFDSDTLAALRAAVQAHALQVGLTGDLTGDLVLAAHELAANAVAHGAGHGRLRMWRSPGALTCEIVDDGLAGKSHHRESGDPSPGDPSALRDPSCGGNTGETGQSRTLAAPWPLVEGHGLWLAWQVADRLDLWSGHRGTRAVVTFRLSGDN